MYRAPLIGSLLFLLSLQNIHAADHAPPEIAEIGNGVWRLRFGTPEAFTPESFRVKPVDVAGLEKLPSPSVLPFPLEDVACELRGSRAVIQVPCDDSESHIFGFGLDPGALNQRGLRKYLTVSAQVVGETGASHGPVPFYISSAGYGVYVDTARVPLVHVARLAPASAAAMNRNDGPKDPATTEAELYSARPVNGDKAVVFDLPGCSTGVDVYVFTGFSPREVVQRYNLYSGGGFLPPMWGLGQKYRTHTKATQDEVLRLGKSFRENRIPCDMFGLEPGWQTHFYSCSLDWEKERYPDPKTMLDAMNEQGFHMNLWEHAYIHPTSPLYEPLKNRAGDFLVWGGLVVDFAYARNLVHIQRVSRKKPDRHGGQRF